MLNIRMSVLFAASLAATLVWATLPAALANPEKAEPKADSEKVEPKANPEKPAKVESKANPEKPEKVEPKADSEKPEKVEPKADSEEVGPKSVYDEIDVKLLEETFEILDKGSAEEKKKAIEEVRISSDKYAPPVFHIMSKVLFEDGRKDDAAFCFFAGQLRAHFDANRCTDISVREVVKTLNDEYGPAINQYVVKDLPKLEKLISKVVEWDRKTPHNYDHRWINLQGKDAQIEEQFGKGSNSKPPVLSVPKEQWDKIAERTRIEYLNSYKKVIAKLKKVKEERAKEDKSND